MGLWWRGLIGMGLGLTVAGAAFGEPVTGKAAKAMMFPLKGNMVEVLPTLGMDKTLTRIIETVAEQQPWYAAIALSPDEDIMTSQATVAGAQFHDTDAAAAFALAGCEEKRTGAAPCIVVALVRPKGWKARDMQLSLMATEFFQGTYLAADAPKAMALSASTGLWGFAKGEDAANRAVADCAAKGTDVPDCLVAIAD